MTNIDIFIMALKNLFKRKLRTFLTVLGVIIGTASIVVMVSLGLAINQSFDDQLNQLSGIDIIKVQEVIRSSDQYKINKKLSMDDTAVSNFKKIKDVKA